MASLSPLPTVIVVPLSLEFAGIVYFPFGSYSPFELNNIFLNLQGGSPSPISGTCTNGFGNIVKRSLLLTNPFKGVSVAFDWSKNCKLHIPLSFA